ncbi:hypothetical protein TRICI_001494 [Trichomonascus ciferrii]|uniref:Mitochondrial import inner membrane translocase subunit TIM22 n=1 Tax=Trichomonascus ciferrii TaxID=44093 RepID=A0A642V962_9ASCO|nr:hypothetical protein TRICI_001494 [Trichomonascus ciferrii]
MSDGHVEKNGKKILEDEGVQQLVELNKGQRLNLAPVVRVTLAGSIGGLYGLATGFYNGFTRSALQYLAENAHRMPSTKGGWYFYHKRKNYVVLKVGMVQGFKQMVRFGAIASTYFGIEAYIDRIRGTIDFGSSMLAAGTVGLGYGLTAGLSRKQTIRSARSFMIFGGIVGFLQDVIRYKKGNDVWYVRRLQRQTPASI